ncbi:uncharacterized protein LOC123524054 [Mercenaria mercenaria]|uniref:uncharacterized protein LOC123524054 n=1 Tax=Mercenaria mercenaria TaxID=6596 RepID=UPI00234E7E37|nr:uncharacterized protein LOC123524054 [Mercenaria mercenaria]
MSDNPEDTEYYLRIISMYIDIGTETVLKLFYHCKPKEDIDQFLSNSKTILEDLKRRNVLKKSQYYLVTSLNPNIEKFDIVLLITLLTNLFPNTNLSPPQSLTSKPDNSNLSIGADLIRLRKFRNNVLCHRPKAHLPKFQFERYWSMVAEILLRIIREIKPDEEDDLKNKLKAYKERKLDSALVIKHSDILRDWEKEIDEIQTQVDDLFRTMKEFDTYFKNKPGRYKRYMRLMIEGGRLVLKAVLNRELSKRRVSLPTFLKENESSLKSKTANIQNIEYLYPKDLSQVNDSNPDDWNVSLLVEFVLNSFDDLEPEDKEDIEAIKTAHNSYADTALLSLDSDRFTGVLIELSNRLTSVANSLGKEVKSKLKTLIASCSKTDDEVDTSAEDYLENLHKTCSNIRSLNDVHIATIRKLKEFLHQMDVEGISFKTEQKLEIKFQTTSHERETAVKAEDTIYTVLLEAISKSVDTSGLPVVRHTIDKILEMLTAHTDVTNIEVKRHCIIVEISCSSTSGIQHVLNIFESDVFHNLLHSVSVEMMSELSDTVAIQTNFTFESLNEILTHRNDVPEDREIVIQVPFKSAADLNRILSPFESRELTNNANRISGYMSDHFSETIKFLVSHEMKGISDSDTSASSPKSEDFENETEKQFLDEAQTPDHEYGNVDIDDMKQETPKDIPGRDTNSPLAKVQKIHSDGSGDEFSYIEDLGRWQNMWEICNEKLKGKDTYGMSNKYCQLVTFVIDICPKPLRRCFISQATTDTQYPYRNLEKYLQLRKQDITNLRQQHIISPDQYANIYPMAASVDIQTWDVSLLTILLLELFQAKLQQEEKECIRRIQSIWNRLKYIGNSSLLTLHMFQSYSNDLKDAVRKLSLSGESWQLNRKVDFPSVLTESTNVMVPVSKIAAMYAKLEEKLDRQAAEIQTLKEETKQSHKILTKSSVKKVSRSGVAEKRMKIVDQKVERMKENLTRALTEHNICEETHREDILRIYQKLCESHRVIVTGHNNSMIYRCALAAIKLMKCEQCLEINNPSDWQRIGTEDASLVLFREPFGILTYESQKVEVMLEEFDSMLDATTDDKDDDVMDIIIVTSQTLLSEVARRHDHEMLSPSCTVKIESDEDNSCEYAYANKDTVHKNLQDISQIYKEKYIRKTVDKHFKQEVETLFIANNTVTIIGPVGSGKTTLAFQLLSSYDLSNGEDNFLVIVDPSELKFVNFFLRPVIIIKLLAGIKFDRIEAHKWYRQFDRLYAAVKDNKLAVILTIETEVFLEWQRNMPTHPVLEHFVYMRESPPKKRQKIYHEYKNQAASGSKEFVPLQM